MNKNLKYIVLSCLLFSAAILFLACIALWKNQPFSGGNHSVFFGTSVESFLMNYAPVIPMLACLPLIIPFLLRRKRIFFLLALCVLPVYLFLKYSIATLTD